MDRLWPAKSRLFLFIALPSIVFSTDIYSIYTELEDIIHLTVSEHYDKAATEVNTNPSYEGTALYHFLHAGILQSQMQDYKSLKWQDSFYAHIDSALIFSKREYQKNRQSLPLFVQGAAIGYKSFHKAKTNNYIQSFLLAQESVEILKQVIERDSLFYDAYVGIGNYYYWRSKILEHLTWLPLVKDRRQEGIKLLLQCAENGELSKWASISNLAWIYIKEKEYTQAVAWAEKGLAQFPEARSFLWPKGDALFHQKKYITAEKVYQKILVSVLECDYNNGYYEMLLYLKIAKCHFYLGQYEKAENYCHKVLARIPYKEVESACAEKQDQADELLKEIKIVSTEKKSGILQ